VALSIRAAIVGAFLVSGCARPTSLFLRVDLANSQPEPVRLRVTEYGAGLLGEPKLVPMGSRALPNELDLRPLDPTQPSFRFLLTGLDENGLVSSQIAKRVALRAHDETRLEVVLGARMNDLDDDGVPDEIDDCPTSYDPLQDCPAADGGVVVGTGRCPPGAILCESFDEGLNPPWSASKPAANDTLDVIRVDGVNPHGGGGQSLHVMALQPMLTRPRVLGVERSFPSTPTVALRAYFYLKGDLGPHGFIAQLYTDAGANGSLGISLGENGGQWIISQDLASTPVADPNPDAPSTVPIPIGEWTCVEMVVTRNPTSTELLVIVKPDGRGPVTVQDMLLDPGFSRVNFANLSLGYPRVPPQMTDEVFIDDVVLAPARVPCP
jgi:hypothetical protein